MGTKAPIVFRDYQSTHPWIRFEADLRQLQHETWMLLGEARSKCEHIAGVPLLPETAKRLYKVYLSKGVHATTAIEGNTLSEEEVQQRVDGTLELSKSRAYLGVEVDNIIAACNEIVADVYSGRSLELTPERVKHFNHQVLQGLELEEGVIAGTCRAHNVGVGRYRGVPYQDCEFLLERLCHWLNSLTLDDHSSGMQFALAVLKAILAHVYIAWIHPFGDGNGRTARLIEVQLLMQSGFFPMPSAFVLSNHYNQTRDKYYRELDKSSRTGGELQSFIDYAVQGLVDGLREQLHVIRTQQLGVTWQNYVHEMFRDQDTPAARRRKHLVLDMPDGAVSRSELMFVSARVAQAFAEKGEKTLTRDLNALERLNLIIRLGRGSYQANRDTILAFLPPKAK
ncbi:MAG: Fic family protein [Thermoleophilia bacterium]